ncbi:MAG: nicotinamide riboside transporter PnuC [Gammaproteobacteria bacterium]|nr:nicotinamide riboside transporter PnuC [Gammaproteobacteria bacterium]
MTSSLDNLMTQLAAWTPAEAVAVIFAILYLLLAIRENIWCWLCAGISTAIYVWLFIIAKLYMESLLNIFYFGMAIYGWSVWSRGRDDSHELPVTVWPPRLHVTALVIIALLVAGAGYLLREYTDAAFPFVDTATTFAAIWATFLVARKVLENWWYWLVIDLVSIFIYWARDLELTALLFVVYVVMIPFGIVRWTRSWRSTSVSVTV